MADQSQISEGEDSSVDTPPPPPLAEGEGMEDQEEERYQEKLKVFKEMAEFSVPNNEETDFGDDGSLEVSPPENYEKMGATTDKGGATRYGMIAVCLLVVLSVILGVGFGTGAFTGDESTEGVDNAALAPVQNVPPEDTVNGETVGTPDPESRESRMRSYIASKSPNDDSLFLDPTSPEAQALQWLQDEDTLELDPLDFENHWRIDQRYALLTLWFNSQSDWFDQTNWLSEDECTWLGVTCGDAVPATQGRRKLQENSTLVTRLEIEGNNLQGRIPVDLSLLVDLKILNLASNAISGPIPPTIANLSKLTTLVLNDNTLTGALSGVDLSRLAALEILDVSGNNLVGPLPESIWTMPSINVLVMDDNAFSGELSTSVANLQSLRKSCLFCETDRPTQSLKSLFSLDQSVSLFQTTNWKEQSRLNLALYRA